MKIYRFLMVRILIIASVAILVQHNPPITIQEEQPNTIEQCHKLVSPEAWPDSCDG